MFWNEGLSHSLSSLSDFFHFSSLSFSISNVAMNVFRVFYKVESEYRLGAHSRWKPIVSLSAFLVGSCIIICMLRWYVPVVCVNCFYFIYVELYSMFGKTAWYDER